MRFLRKSSLSYIVFPWRSRNKTQNVSRDGSPCFRIGSRIAIQLPTRNNITLMYVQPYNYCENLNRGLFFVIVGNTPKHDANALL